MTASETIFISLASYREPELQQTIESALAMADNPEALHFGVYSQVAEGEHPDLSHIDNLKEEVVPYTEAKGPGYARAQVQKFYDGEDFFFQLDAHSLFTEGWDSRFKEWLNKIQPYSSRNIISAWAEPYMYDSEGAVQLGKHLTTEEGVTGAHTTWVGRWYKSWIAAREPLEGRAYAWAPVGLAGMWFCRGNFVEEVPYDPRIPWNGEEFLLSLRAYCAGWRIYGVDDVFIYHNYERHGNARVWEDNPEWEELQSVALQVQDRILNLREPEPYGLKSKYYYGEFMNRVQINNFGKHASRFANDPDAKPWVKRR